MERVKAAFDCRALSNVGEFSALEVLHDLDALSGLPGQAFQPVRLLGESLIIFYLFRCFLCFGIFGLAGFLDGLRLILEVFGCDFERILDFHSEVFLQSFD